MSAMTQEVIVEPGTNPLVVDGSAVTQPISGAVSVSNFPATQPVSGTVNVGNFPATQNVAVISSVEVEVKNDSGSPIPVSGSVTTTPVVSNSSTVIQITSTGANQTLLAANANRKKVYLFFSTGVWNVKLGVGASATSRTLQVSTGGFFAEVTTWTGQIDAFCTSSGKLVDVTELI